MIKSFVEAEIINIMDDTKRIIEIIHRLHEVKREQLDWPPYCSEAPRLPSEFHL